MRIGVVRELMDRKELEGDASGQTIDLVNKAVEDLRGHWAPTSSIRVKAVRYSGQCVRKYAPKLGNKIFTKKYADAFPLDKAGKPKGDHVATLIDLVRDPSKVPEGFLLHGDAAR